MGESLVSPQMLLNRTQRGVNCRAQWHKGKGVTSCPVQQGQDISSQHWFLVFTSQVFRTKASSTAFSGVSSYYLLNSVVPATLLRKDAFSIATLMCMVMEVLPDIASGPWEKVPLLENSLLQKPKHSQIVFLFFCAYT